MDLIDTNPDSDPLNVFSTSSPIDGNMTWGDFPPTRKRGMGESGTSLFSDEYFVSKKN